ncbi:MAG: PAS domain-containing sensor histidine kinase [Aggregatilineales bacterium]
MPQLSVSQQVMDQLSRLATEANISIDSLLAKSLQHYEASLTADDKPDTPIIPERAPKSNPLTVASEAVEESDLLKLIAENILDLVCLHEPNGRVIYASPSAKAVTGFVPQQMVGTNPYDFFYADDIGAIRDSHAASLSGNKVHSVVYRRRKKDGTYVWLDTLTAPIVDEAGNVINLLTVSRDVTERIVTEKTLAEERDLFKIIMETSPSGIMVVDKSGQIIFSNNRAEEITGMTPEEKSTDRSYDSPEWKHTDYDGNPWLDEQQPFVRVMQTKESVWDVRHAIEWSNGRTVYLSINGAPILDEHGEVDKVVFTIEDYTDRKRQQDALTDAFEREKHLNKLKSNFISMVSHEFRTPLTVIMTSSEIIRRKLDELTQAQLETRLDKIAGQVQHLAKLLSEVTFINRDEMIGITPQHKSLNLPVFIEQIVDEIQSVFPAHQPIKVSITVPSTDFLIDESLVQKIVTNLLSNAMKYSPLESEVTFACSVEGQTLLLTVTDHGIGIPAKDQHNLFSEFHRAHNVGTIKGTGLGLAIVKRAVDALGGQIDYESTEESGTMFVVKLPINVNSDHHLSK